MTRPLDEQGVQRAYAAIIATWVEPELRRRIEQGRLPDDFKLTAYQLVTDTEGVVREVRLNEEVRAAVRRRTRRERALDDVRLGDPTVDVPEILLTDDKADAEAGHITSIATGDGGWLTSIDLRPNARQAAEHGAAAREYLNSAGASLERGELRAFAQSLFDATELMAKAYLLTMPAGYKAGSTHAAVARPFNLERKAGNVNARYAALLDRLVELRPSGRYLKGDVTLDAAEAREMMATAEEMHRVLYDVVPKRHARREPA